MNAELRMKVVLVVAAGCFFVLSASIALRLERVGYPSPDETAAAAFMQRVAAGLPLAIPEALNATLENIVHPRSTTIVHGAIVPQGFPLQMVLWGTFSRLTGLPISIWTPLLGALSLPVLFILLQAFFSLRIAWISTLLAFAHPAVFYYTSRGLYSNAPQLFFLILALFLFSGTSRWRWAVGGAILGLAVGLRPSELLWIAPMIGLLGWWNRTALEGKNIRVGAVAFAFVGILVLLLHLRLYGGEVLGYSLSSATSTITGGAWSLWTILVHAKMYLLSLFWWWAILGVGGVITSLRGVPTAVGATKQSSPSLGLLRFDRHSPVPVFARNDGWEQYLILTSVVAAILLLLYGNWNLRDTVSEEAATIGTSFVRYWLPLFVLTLPLAALVFTTPRFPTSVAVLFVLLSLLYPTVWGFEGLGRELGSARDGRRLLGRAQQVMPSNAVLLVERSDKIFWPEFRVISGVTEQQKVRRLLLRLAAETPVYFHRERDLAFATFWNEQHLAKVGLEFGEPIELDEENEMVPIVPL